MARPSHALSPQAAASSRDRARMLFVVPPAPYNVVTCRSGTRPLTTHTRGLICVGNCRAFITRRASSLSPPPIRGDDDDDGSLCPLLLNSSSGTNFSASFGGSPLGHHSGGKPV